jgi:tol-pal system protein YbgF
MDCKQADNLMIDFLYGELSPGDRAAFESHLKSCPEHTREVEKLRGVLNLVRAQEPEEVPEAVSARIMANARARMPRKPKTAPFFSLIWNPVAAAAVLALVVVTVGLATYFTSEPGPEEEPALEAARPLALAEKPQPLPVETTKAEEKKEYAAAPEPKLPIEAPVAEPAPKPAEKFYKKPKRKKSRKVPGKKKGYKSTFAPPPKTPEVWGSRAKPKAGLTTGATGGAAAPGETAVVGKTDRGMEGAAGAEYEKKAKDKKKEKKVSRPYEERDFAKPPPPMKAAPAPATPPPREEAMEAESSAISADMEDDSYPQAAPRARKVAKKEPVDYYKAAEGDLANKRYDAAVSKYRTFLAQNPSDPRAATARYRIAKALFLAGRCSEAVKAVETAVSASPRHPMAPNALLDQGSCYERLNRLSEANATYRRINRDYPSYTEEAQKGMRRTRREAESDVRPTSTEQR